MRPQIVDAVLFGIQITGVSVFAQWQPFVDGVYTCSGGRSAEGYDSTLVRLDTDEGIVGWGEMAPLGSFYDPSFAAGAREGLRILARWCSASTPATTRR